MLCVVAGADEAELVRVVAARVLHRQAVLVRLADVAAVKPRAPDRRRPADRSRISWPANSSLGDSAGCVSDAPLSCWISVSGSLFTRDCAHAASIGRPLLSTSSGNMTPSDRFALCEIASSSLPALRWPSIQFHRSSG